LCSVSVYVDCNISFQSVSNCDYPSKPIKYISGESHYGRWMKIDDKGRFKAKYVAVKSDTITAQVLLWVKPYKSENIGAYGGGLKHECFIITESEGIGLGDCWTHYSFFKPPVSVQLVVLPNAGLDKNHRLSFNILSNTRNLILILGYF